ncbi:hypothetical protein ANCCAN_04673 [Ancylostoma caninum]|uniref:Uncharacterized protein n=1 Tax=Ancylostoma caninum TaxID=29170 RepID=A0A368H0D5_ANCCA|nr:hypothetical protein ANCCAN_04673 [Ancylostoma caninum]
MDVATEYTKAVLMVADLVRSTTVIWKMQKQNLKKFTQKRFKKKPSIESIEGADKMPVGQVATKACSANYNACLMRRSADDCTKEMKECSSGCVAINATTHCGFALNSLIEGLERKKRPEEQEVPELVPERPGPEEPKRPEEPQEPGTITRATRVGGTLKPHTPGSSSRDKASSILSETSSSKGFLNDTVALVIILILAGVVLIQGCFIFAMRRRGRVHPTSAKSSVAEND